MEPSNFYHYIIPILDSYRDQALISQEDNKKMTLSSHTGLDIKNRIGYFQQLFKTGKVDNGANILLIINLEQGLIEAVLACIAMGLCPVIPPKGLKKTTIPFFLRRYAIKVSILSPDVNFINLLLMKTMVKAIKIEASLNENFDLEVEVKDDIDISQVALTSFSSGSTGEPKRIERTHEILSAQHLALKSIFPKWKTQVDFPLFPNVVLHNLASGVPTVFPNIKNFNLKDLDPELIHHQLMQSEIQSMSGNAYYYTQLVGFAERGNYQYDNIKGLVIGGSPVTDSLLKRMAEVFVQAVIYVVYGATEAEPIAIRECQPDENNLNMCYGYVVGKPYDGLTLELDSPVELSSVGYHSGQVMVKGKHVITGGKEWLATGDHGYIDDEGKLVLTARRGNEGVYGGFQHYMLEHPINNIDGVVNAAAISTLKGFQLYYCGEITKENLEKKLCNYDFFDVIVSIEKRDQLPMDKRHLSKVLYPVFK
ncbi:MAG: AMP-binding protein [Reichenbachiella sp.]